MLVKEVLRDEPVTIAEVRERLIELRRETEDAGYARRRALDHVEKFSKLTAEEAEELLGELEDLEKMTPEIAVKMVDLLPEDADGVRAIYSKERFALDEGNIEEILGLLEKYR